MKAKLEHGADIEFVTPDELRTILDSQKLGGPERAWPEQAITLDANGNGTMRLYAVPVDRTFTLHRLTIGADSYTPVAPFTDPAGYVEIHRNGKAVDFVAYSAAAGGLPAVGTWGTEDGPHYAEREKIELVFHAGPRSGTVVVLGQGTLFPPSAGS